MIVEIWIMASHSRKEKRWKMNNEQLVISIQFVEWSILSANKKTISHSTSTQSTCAEFKCELNSSGQVQCNSFIYLLYFSDEFIKTCQIDDPNFEACSRESIQVLFKKLVTGKKANSVEVRSQPNHNISFWKVSMDSKASKLLIRWNWIVLRFSKAMDQSASIHQYRKQLSPDLQTQKLCSASMLIANYVRLPQY